jgi:hypothetical protein
LLKGVRVLPYALAVNVGRLPASNS